MLILSLFLAIGISSARLSCDGEAVTVPAHMDTTGTVEIVSVVCDEIGPYCETGFGISANGCMTVEGGASGWSDSD
jgi:hypothetical protein